MKIKSINVLSAVSVHVGKIRENNEDNFYYNGIYLDEHNREVPVSYHEQTKNSIQIYAVCDGMGGEELGEVASYIAVETLKKYQEMLHTISYGDFNRYMEMYLSEANYLIYQQSKKNGRKRIGTTIAMLCVEGDNIHIYNVGDSRVYLLQRKKLRQISEDHTHAMHAIKMGAMTREEAITHPYRNKLTQYLGISPEEMIIKPYYYKMKVSYGDMFLLCSDGITDMIEEHEIEYILTQKKDEKSIVNDLISKAMENGGKDNATAMVLRITHRSGLFRFISG